jgi:tRNA dimethylallyltransferase
MSAPNQQTDRRHDSSKSKLVVVTGPTAVGKTAFAIELASRLDGEIVNADSRYFYRGFDIGVAKPSTAERQLVPHHLIDILDPEDDMSLALYQERAYRVIDEIAARGHLPLLTGGTPLYINAVVEGWKIPEVPPNPAFRADLEQQARASGPGSLLERLAAVDPESANRTGTNVRRIIRALEVFAATGKPLSSLQSKGPPPYDVLELGLTMPRKMLYERIDQRIDKQIERGLVEEVRQLIHAGVPAKAPAMSAIGYRQLLPYLSGEESLEIAIERIKSDTRRYVRHQETWFRKNKRLLPIDVTQRGWESGAYALVAHFLAFDSPYVS